MAEATRRPALREAWVRSVDAGRLLERFLVAGAAAFVGVRLYLELTGYPQIGGNGFHIAHLLWGGLLMLVAAVLLLAFPSRDLRYRLAVIAGAGWGLFIDELGKFVTSDVNYFYRPAISLIYATFVLLFVWFRLIEDRARPTPRTALAQATELLQAGAARGLRPAEQNQALALLDHADPGDAATPHLRAAALALGSASPERMGLVGAGGAALGAWYDRFRRSRLFVPVVVALVLLQALSSLADLGSEIVGDPAYQPGAPALDWGDALRIGASAMGGILIVVGVAGLRSGRLTAFKWMRAGLLTVLLLAQPMAFYAEQMLALWGLAFNLLLLAGVNGAISRESGEGSRSGNEHAAPAPLAVASSG